MEKNNQTPTVTYPGWSGQFQFDSKIKNLIKEIPALDILSNDSNDWSNSFYLNPSSSYKYNIELTYFTSKFSNKSKDNQNSVFKNIAKKIGFLLINNADWFPVDDSEKRCNWVSFDNYEYKENGTISAVNFKLLDNSFVNGILGVCFFLKILYDIFPKVKEFDTTFYRASKSIINFSNPSDIEKMFLSYTEYWYQKNDYDLNGLNLSLSTSRPKNHNKIGLIKLLDEIIFTDYDTEKVYKNPNFKELLDHLNEFYENDMPFSFLTNTEEFCPSFDLGLSYVGYACLRLHNINLFPRLFLQVTYS